MKKRLFFAIILFAQTTYLKAQYYFPPNGSDEWETTTPESLGWCTDSIPALYQLLEENSTRAFLVLKDGRIVLEQYFNGHAQDSAWYWASAGKTLTAFLVGTAQQDGDLDLQDPASDYLGTGWTGCDPAQEALITVWSQLTMTEGMDDADFECTTPDCLTCLADAGTRWAYHNGPYRLLYKVTEAATGINYNLYTFQKLLQPTGMTGLWFINEEQLLFLSTARSMARFGSLTINGGNWAGNQLLTDPAYFTAMTTPSQALNPSYGYLWWLNGQSTFKLPGLQADLPGPLNPFAPLDMYSAMGKNGQFLDVVPSLGLVVVRMGDFPDNSPVPFLFQRDIWEKLSPVINCTATAGAEAASPNEGLQVSPNPFSNQLTISHLAAPEGVLRAGQTLCLTDFFGREMATSSQPTIATGHLPAGIYFLQVKENGRTVWEQRVVK